KGFAPPTARSRRHGLRPKVTCNVTWAHTTMRRGPRIVAAGFTFASEANVVNVGDRRRNVVTAIFPASLYHDGSGNGGILMHTLLQPLATARRLVTLPPVLAGVAIDLLLCLSGRVSLPGPFGGYDGHRWGALLLLALVAVGGRSLPNLRALRLPLALIAVGVISTSLAPYPVEALAVLATHAGLLLL